MAVVAIKTNNMNGGHLQNQLTKSLERILDEANLSGELKLSGRKLRDFPKIAAGKYNLCDTVIADLSRNRFCELPEDVTSFAFLETLFAYHNAIKTIPDSVRGLQSLSYLDLRNNQLALLPREICFLPLQVLLVSNNRLISLPEELGRMEQLTELDASCNQITHLPARIGDLTNLRSLALRNNQLVYLPREITYLQLVALDISCNKISTLPVELRSMTSLVDLELGNNPLTSPPASLCVRGLVHVFKYLETAAVQEKKSGSGNYDGQTTLRRSMTPRHTNNLIEGQRCNSNSSINNRRHHVDSGYSTSDGLDKKWTIEQQQNLLEQTSKFSPTPLHIRTELPSGSSTPSTISPTSNVIIGNNNSNERGGDVHTLEEELKRANILQEHKSSFSSSPSNSTDVSPEGEHDVNEKNRTLGSIQTYREYKEALRQQRNQDSTSIYRSKEQSTTPPDNNIDSPTSNPASSKSHSSTPSPSVYSSSNQSSPLSPHHHNINGHNNYLYNNDNRNIITSSPTHNRNLTHFDDCNGSSGGGGVSGNGNIVTIKKPIQKVIPSRNSNTYQNGNCDTKTSTNGKTTNNDYSSYVKPQSPFKTTTGILNHNNVPTGVLKNGNTQRKTNTMGKGTEQKPNRNVSWNRDVPADKMSFTMRREIDKQKEESELIDQLRTIIESRLKMTLPDDIAPALTDGVVLCHLANHVKPRSVGSIHVPSPTVPKLTMARCRKNVDNFLEACRKIGVDEELICSSEDILSSDVNDVINPPNSTAITRTVNELLKQRVDTKKLKTAQQTTTSIVTASTTTATNTNQTQDEFTNYDNYFKKIGIHFPKGTTTVTTTNQQKYNEYFINNDCDLNETNIDGNNDDDGVVDDHDVNDVEDNDEDANDNNIEFIDHFKEGRGRDTNKHNITTDMNLNLTKNINNKRNLPNTLDLTTEQQQRKSKIAKNKRNFYLISNNGLNGNNGLNLNGSGSGGILNRYDNFQLNGIIEECEYDSDIGKFNCKTDINLINNSDNSSSNISSSTPLNDYSIINDLNTPKQQRQHNYFNEFLNDDLNIDTKNSLSQKIVMKRIEFFENGSNIGTNEKIVNNIGIIDDHIVQKSTNVDVNFMSTILLLGTFILTILLLILFPLPN